LNKSIKEKKLVAAIACRNQGTRLYAKPLQNLCIQDNITILDNIIDCLKTIESISSIVLGVSEGIENEIFLKYASEKGVHSIVGNQTDVLDRLIKCGQLLDASDIFRITSESPFPNFDKVEEGWHLHNSTNADATFLDDIVDGCNYEIISLNALVKSHQEGDEKHRSEFCSLYIRENIKDFNIQKLKVNKNLFRKDLRLTVDNPEDLVVCRKIFGEFKNLAPRIPISKIIKFLDKNPDLIKLTLPFVEEGYKTMYL
tara:strand:- start:35747 stop:36514 length:768 start_codon:yes stop_codon:yes gene_type:complete